MSTRNVDELDNSLIEREIRIGTQIPIVRASITWSTVHTGDAKYEALKIVSRDNISGMEMEGIPIRMIKISIALINK